MKKAFTILLFISLFVAGSAQELNLGVDVFNRYIWRGLDLGGKSPNIQPWANVKFGNENHLVTIGVWSAFSVASTANEEIDLSVNYCYKGVFNVMVSDYFFPGLNTGVKENYFEYRADSTGHVFEGALSFTGTEKIPFTALFAMNFYGNDARRANGDLFMSKYVEFGYKKNVNGIDINPFIGAALDKPETGETSFYLNEKVGVTNLGIKLSKSISITDKFALPVQCSFVTNPELNKVFLAFGISF